MSSVSIEPFLTSTCFSAPEKYTAAYVLCLLDICMLTFLQRFLSHLSDRHTPRHTSGLLSLWGLSIDVTVCILYKLYILSPYTNPIPKPTHHIKLSAFLHIQKTHSVLFIGCLLNLGPHGGTSSHESVCIQVEFPTRIEKHVHTQTFTAVNTGAPTHRKGQRCRQIFCFFHCGYN